MLATQKIELKRSAAGMETAPSVLHFPAPSILRSFLSRPQVMYRNCNANIRIDWRPFQNAEYSAL